MLTENIFYSEKRKGEYLNYYLKPNGKNNNSPLGIYIHGAGSRGNELSQMARIGPLNEKCDELDAVIVAPQCHTDTWFELFDVLIEFIEYSINREGIDKSRVYLMGVSMGAYAAWQVAMARAKWFAALVPICGGGMYWNASRLKNLPIWAFHGALDTTVLPEEIVHMVKVVNLSGGNAKITIYPHADHNSWDLAFSEEEMWQWLFCQKSVTVTI